MMKVGERERTLDGVQSVVGIVGITLGVIPFVRWLITGELGGLFRWIFGEFAVTLGYMAPLVVIAVSLVAITALELMKRKRS